MRLLLKTALLISLATLAMPGWAECVSGNCVNGYGVEEFDTVRYEGDYLDGKIHGKGVSTWADGSRYEGDWVYNKQHGKGVWTYGSGAKPNPRKFNNPQPHPSHNLTQKNTSKKQCHKRSFMEHVIGP